MYFGCLYVHSNGLTHVNFECKNPLNTQFCFEFFHFMLAFEIGSTVNISCKVNTKFADDLAPYIARLSAGMALS